MSNWVKNGVWRRIEPYLFTMLLLLIMVVAGYLHARAGYTLPVPWQDESPFIWQAKAWAQLDNLFAPEVNPERPIYWMPPLYFVRLGTWFKMAGVSLASARWFSFMLVMLAVLVLALILRRYPWPSLSLAIAAPFVLTAPWVAVGNVARMDALLLLVVLASFYGLVLGRWLLASIIMALGPLVHPNGCYFALAMGIYVGLETVRHRLWRKPDRVETAQLILVGVIWAGYIGWVIFHWEPFINDMTPQFARKAERNVLAKVISLTNLAGILALVGAVWYSMRRQLNLGPLVTLILPAWFVFAAGQEMWYYVFRSLSYALMAIVFTFVVISIVYNVRWSKIRRTGPVWIGVFLLVIFWRAWKTEHIGPPPWQAERMNFQDMWISAKPYVDSHSLDIVRAHVATLVHDSGAAIQFDPRGDAFFFFEHNPRLQFSDPFFAERSVAWHVIHVSLLQPPDLLEYRLKELERAGIRLNDLDDYLVHKEGSTERWYLIRNGVADRMASDSGQRGAPTISQK